MIDLDARLNGLYDLQAPPLGNVLYAQVIVLPKLSGAERAEAVAAGTLLPAEPSAVDSGPVIDASPAAVIDALPEPADQTERKGAGMSRLDELEAIIERIVPKRTMSPISFENPHIGNNTPNRSVTIIVNWARVGSAFAFLVLSRVAQAEDFVWKYGAIRIVA